MKKISKKAILSILTLVLTVVVLGASTFAWFTLGTTATVDNFDVNVTSSEGLEISLDGNNWYTRLNSDIMRDYIENQVTTARLNNDGDFVMDAVTTSDGIDFFKFSISGNEMVHTESDKAVANEDFLQLQFKLRTKVNQKVILSNLGVTSTLESWTSDQDFTLAKGNTPVTSTGSTSSINADLADALRVSVLAVASHGDDVTDPVVFEKDNTGSTNTTGTLAKDSSDNYIGAFEYYSKKSGFTNLLETNFEPKSATANFGSNTTKLADFTSQTLSGGEDYYTVDVTFNIWFEGYDNEAFDAVLDQMVSIVLAFQLVP